MMTKEYHALSSNWFYFIKLLIFGLALILFWQFAIGVLIFDFFIQWWQNGFGPMGYIADFVKNLKNFFMGKRNIRFIIGFSEDQLSTRYSSYPFDDIKSYGEARGGSEAFLMLINGKRIDLETSWLTQEEQEEIATFLTHRIHGKGQS